SNGDKDVDHLQLAKTINDYLQQNSHYGSNEEYYIESIDATSRTLVFRTTATRGRIGLEGKLDEGWVATMADNMTSVLIAAFTGLQVSVSSTLAVHALASVDAGTELRVVCRLENVDGPRSHATASFVDAKDPHRVYAVANHTKIAKGTTQLSAESTHYKPASL
ncbi:hypothetical protein EV182_005979, partial [Spiromyces aspiralis]